MSSHKILDPRARPPKIIQDRYKSLQKSFATDEVLDVIDLRNAKVHVASTISKDIVVQACLAIENEVDIVVAHQILDQSARECHMYEHEHVPGLWIVPSLIPPRAQETLLSSLLHRDLRNPQHLTNVHLHHTLPYPSNQKSFFSLPQDGPNIEPLDESKHKPIPFASFMTRKLRWATLGGQYDWSAKVYPSGPTPTFPPDLSKFLETLFPSMKAEAAILNVYSPGDVLSMHRDIAEESDKGLISISIGCDATFLIGLESYDSDGNPQEPLALRLKSGDAVFMGGESRFAWHGVPKIVPDTCPDYLRQWPAAATEDEPNEYDHWRGWMAHKRINLNVRQMWD